MINEAIILAGGFGTRLNKIIKDVPKPMAEINKKPFLEFLLDRLFKQGINKAILAVGYRHEKIIDYFQSNPHKIALEFSIEIEPLGTGGALKKALEKTTSEDVFAFNGDSFFKMDLSHFYNEHKKNKADISIALKYVGKSDRYSSVCIDDNSRVISFEKLSHEKNILISSGMYVLKKDLLKDMPQKFSFEKDFLEKEYKHVSIYGTVFDGFFIDIGIPEDYERAKNELGKQI
jgi:D-glycero-alpha-D-manno-heptose 1-phosphate guanylyltransferase